MTNNRGDLTFGSKPGPQYWPRVARVYECDAVIRRGVTVHGTSRVTERHVTGHRSVYIFSCVTVRMS